MRGGCNHAVMTRKKRIIAAMGGILGGLALAAVFSPVRMVSTEIDIAASPARVWSILADTDRYPQWNPFMRRMTGALVPGGRIVVSLASGEGGAGDDAIVFRPRVLAVQPGHELRWIGRLWSVPGLFTGTHRFVLHATEQGTVLQQSERFSGLFLWFYDVAPLRAAFGRMNVALKQQAERQGGA